MLRLVAVFLLLANLGYYAWSAGLLRSWGMAPVEQSEPQHLAQQIAPEALRILPAPGAVPEGEAPPQSAPSAAPPPASESAPATAPAAPETAAPASTEPAPPPPEAVVLVPTVTPPPVAATRGECLQAGPFSPEQAEVWRQAAAAALPQGSWQLESTPIPARWMVYMGRFEDTDMLAKKRIELRIRKVSFDRPNNPELEPGLSLGRFATEEAAERGLVNLANQGVRTARVIKERPESEIFNLRLPLVDAALQAKLSRMQSALAGKPLRSCFEAK